MNVLIIGLVVFIGCHLLPAFPGARKAIADRLGVNVYRGLFSLVALAGLVLIIWGYGAAREEGSPLVYDPPLFLRHITHLLMLPVFVLLVSAYAHGRITQIVKHPMVLAVKLWAFAHLLANGDLASVLLFGGFLAWAIFDRISLARRQRAGLVTVRGGPATNDIIAIVVGLAIYGVLIWKAHTWLIGVPVF